MYPYSPSVTPAAQHHLQAQMAFFNDMSRSMFRTVQQFNELNIQLAQDMLEESTRTSQEVLCAQRASDALACAASHAQPAVENLRSYQQHLSRIAADTQVDLSKVASEHVEHTSRTAKDLVAEVARVASEEAERSMRNRQGNGEQRADGSGRSEQAGRSGQSDQADHAGNSVGSMSGAHAEQAGRAQGSAAQTAGQQSGSAGKHAAGKNS